jgi:ornithine cyclodeaminase/alanine dehydrogenase
VLEATRLAYKEFSAGSTLSPLRTRLHLHNGGRYAVMPAYAASALGTKIVGYFPDNPDYQLPRTLGVYVLNDPKTGLPLAIMDATFITSVRTAGGGIVATQALACPGWRCLGVIGSGSLAKMSVLGFAESASIDEIHIFSRTKVNKDKFASFLQQRLQMKISVADSPDQVVKKSDVIVCATDTHQPVFDGNDLREGQMVVSIGANTPTTRELDLSTIQAGKLVVDSRASVTAECGELLIPMNEGLLNDNPIYAEIGEILAETIQGREAPEETIIFKATGIGVQDVIFADLVYKEALRLGIGQKGILFSGDVEI